MDLGATLGVKFRGGRNFNLKKFIKMEEEEIAGRINALESLDENDFMEEANDFEEGFLYLWNFNSED